MLLICTGLAWNYMVLILLYNINSSFAPPPQHALEKSEVAPHVLTKLKDAFEPFLRFFRPVTCRHREGQTLIPCPVGAGLNTTKCLENNCCPFQTSYEPICYMPFKDNMQLTFRLIALVAGGFIIMGCLPLCCCAILQKCQCLNHLRWANSRVVKFVKGRAHTEELRGLLQD
ncbi:FMR1 neighbor protein [Pezoporus wallicus]|uniref:FMR1 neighbor protein n=1 Tax=Pezoporus wallicus TaxID=35540 RepID=UPI00254DFF22|nr:FMR1 neighbor protein [Pezoporus wallicus]XP_061301949.1 FMR1 neighbor protein [Pezoporus flaviventris]